MTGPVTSVNENSGRKEYSIFNDQHAPTERTALVHVTGRAVFFEARSDRTARRGSGARNYFIAKEGTPGAKKQNLKIPSPNEINSRGMIDCLDGENGSGGDPEAYRRGLDQLSGTGDARLMGREAGDFGD